MFYSQMVGLYHDPHGETVFTSSSPSTLETPITAMSTDKDETIESLRKRIRELEHDASQHQVSHCSYYN